MRVIDDVEQHLAVEQVEAVVYGAHVDVVAKARAALADVSHLGHDQAVAALRRAGAERGGI